MPRPLHPQGCAATPAGVVEWCSPRTECDPFGRLGVHQPEKPEATMLGLIVSIIIIGLIAGVIARLVVPASRTCRILMTIVLGIVGSFIGGFLGFLIFHHDADGRLLPARRHHRLHHRRDHRAAALDPLQATAARSAADPGAATG